MSILMPFFILTNELSQNNTKQIPDETDCQTDEDFINRFFFKGNSEKSS